MATTDDSEKVVSIAEWEARMAAVQVTKSDLNRLVMDYLVIEGYKDAAEKFASECGTTPDVDFRSIAERMATRVAIQTGDIQKAIERANDLNPLILDKNPELYFHLQQQKLIELIRSGSMEESLRFAQEELAPRGEEMFLSELERTITLLAFDNHSNSPVSELLDASQRQKTASELNSAILSSQCPENDPKLPRLVKLVNWAESQVPDKYKFPKMNPLDGSLTASQ